TGGWSGLTNLLPKRAPEPVRTKRSAGSATLVAPPPENANGNKNELAASSQESVAGESKGKKKSGKKR
ncbi:MAG: hypothetical protein DCC52_16990, partial [Chloroflexi bacterium]